MINSIKRIVELCGPYKSKLIAGIIFSLLHSMLISCSMLAILNIIANINVLSNDIILNSFWILLISVVGQTIFKYLISVYMSGNGYNVACKKRLDIGDCLKNAPMGYFSEKNLGKINSTLSSATAELESLSMMAVENMVSGVIQAICVIGFITYFDWRIGIISIVGLALSSYVLNIIQERTEKQAPIREQTKEDMITKVLEFVQGIAVVKSFGVNRIINIDETFSKNADSHIQLERKAMGIVHVYRGVLQVTSSLVVMCAACLLLADEISFTIGVMIFISSFMIFGKMESMGNGAFLIRMLNSALDKIEEVADIPKIKEGSKDVKIYKHDIELKNVSFGYDKRQIINDVSFRVPENTTTAIVGYSGSGKTTLCNLIARFWDIESGEISIGGRNIKEYSTDELLSNISMVFQKVYLFNDTIENNIKFGKPDATHEEVINAAKKACCYDFIMKLPEGFNTVVGEGGASLSGGERQRISIARAILKDSPIVILDEATSSVDPENEHELLVAINELKKNKTLITIAHRLSTIKDANQIIVLEEGRIAQRGTHKELINQEGIYKKFITCLKQSGGWQIGK